MSPDEVVVFGDSENDVEMLRSLPNSVAVANAAPEASRAARYHIGSCDEGAVVDALRDIAQAAPWGETPAFMRAERGRTEAPASEEPAVSERPRRAPAEVVLGLIVIAVAAALSWARVATTTLTAALLVVVLLFGVALVYLGAAELRDARRARRRSRS